MEQLKMIKENLISQVMSQMGNLQSVDAKELGEVIDMVKDLEEAIYYCTIVEAMEKKDEWPTEQKYYDGGRMYYTEGGGSNGGNNGMSSSGRGSNGGSRSYSERELPIEFRDGREGRSPRYRRMYMESKEMHRPQDMKMKDLKNYLQELSHDITEMVEDATPEEKQMLQKKIAVLATKVNG